MRKVIMYNMASLDGFMAGPNGEIDWTVVSSESSAYAATQLEGTDTYLFGRVTYQMMAGYWPTPEAIKDDPIIADSMNRLEKVVFSRTLTHADWQNTRLVSGDPAAEVSRLRQQPGANMVILGSGSIVSALTKAGLIDEYQINFSPVVLGKGKPLFADISARVSLKLIDTRTFKAGNVVVRYQKA